MPQHKVDIKITLNECNVCVSKRALLPESDDGGSAGCLQENDRGGGGLYVYTSGVVMEGDASVHSNRAVCFVFGLWSIVFRVLYTIYVH